MTPETMQAVSERLGDGYSFGHTDDGQSCIRQGLRPMSDGAMLLAMLNKAAEMGLTAVAEISGAMDGVHRTAYANFRGPRQVLVEAHTKELLEAVALAFAQLPKVTP